MLARSSSDNSRQQKLQSQCSDRQGKPRTSDFLLNFFLKFNAFFLKFFIPCCPLRLDVFLSVYSLPQFFLVYAR
jgi:hypothetical protein